LAYQTVRRRSEIGIRLALGAMRGQIARLVLKQAALLVFVGVVIGLVGSLALGQAVASLIFGISPSNPLQLAAAAIALCAAAAIGAAIPAGHASRLDPMNALHEE
jgi:putative ABC transport system permease protein